MPYVRLKRGLTVQHNRPEFLELTPVLKDALFRIGTLDITYDKSLDRFIVFHVGDVPLRVEDIHYNRKGERGFGLYCGWSTRYCADIRPEYRWVSIYSSPIFPWREGKSDVMKELGGQLVFGKPAVWNQLKFLEAVDRDELGSYFEKYGAEWVNLEDYTLTLVDDPIVSYTQFSENWFTYRTRSGILLSCSEAFVAMKNDGTLKPEDECFDRLYPNMLS